MTEPSAGRTTLTAVASDLSAAWRFAFGGEPPATVAAWAVYLPAMGLLLGALWVAVDRLVGQLGIPWLASAAVLAVNLAATRARLLLALAQTLRALPAPRPRRLALLLDGAQVPSYAAVLAVAAVELILLCALDRFRLVGLVCGPLLGWCAMVVVAVGSREARADGRQMKFAPAVTFREFGLASTATFALVFSTTEFLGLLLILATAAFVVLARIAWHRWLGGVNLTATRATGEAVQLLILALLAIW